MPYDVNNPPAETMPRSALGCWRSHANVWSHIISSGISSALILEDDVDFSVGIKDILEGVSTHLQEVSGARNGEPYGLVDGNSWDMLALGFCNHRLPFPKTNPKAMGKVRSWVDPYAPEIPRLPKKFSPEGRSSRIRVLTPAKGILCTHAYAVTREGAMRLLYNVGGPGHILNLQMDWVMMGLMNRGTLKSYLTLPTIFSQWRTGDWRGTDIQEKFSPKHGSSPQIIGSVRSELAEVLGKRNVWGEYERD